MEVAEFRPGATWSCPRRGGTYAAVTGIPPAPLFREPVLGGVPTGGRSSSATVVELSAVSPASLSSPTRARFWGILDQEDLRTHDNGRGNHNPTRARRVQDRSPDSPQGSFSSEEAPSLLRQISEEVWHRHALIVSFTGKNQGREGFGFSI